ncbi:MAG: extracellular solute-binding protein [Chloroflexota bacterium]|nr:extracellular solute-binding protein [Chloroflexota bacterium]
MKQRVLFVWLVVLSLLLAACGGGAPAAPADAPASEAAAPAPNTAASEALTTTETTTETTTTAEPAADASGVTELKILWAQWDPADYLQEIGNLYEAETGIKVSIVQEPWGSFYNLAFTEFAAKGDTWDMIVGDSQWLGQAATQGHYIDMTEFLTSNGIDKTVTPATLTYYGEYPTGSGTYYAYPTEGDADGWAYRKDLFENADEQAAFEAEYGYALAVPKTWAELLDIAKFFTRPDADPPLYGAAVYTQKDYDAITMGFENVMFSYGADWKNAETNEVLGVANSAEAVAALDFYRELYQCCSPPGMGNAFFQESNDVFISGQAVMAMNYFAFFPALASEAINPHAANTDYFANPAGPDGARHAALGGQGISVISYVSPERQQAALDFIQWFAQEEIQTEWALFGGYTCNINVLASQEFLDVAPYNAAFAETMTMVKDYWNIPVFGQLLEVTQRELSGYIVPEEVTDTAEQVLTRMAEEHDKILRENDVIQ